MSFRELKQFLHADYLRYSRHNQKVSPIVFYIKFDTLRLITWFRIGSYLRTHNNIAAKIAYGIAWIVYRHLQHSLGIQLPLGTKIGGGLRFPHYGSIVFAQSVIIGKNATIHNDVTIGRVFAGEHEGTPTIGDNVVLFSGAKVFGRINIGDYTIIGANSVVNRSFEGGAVLAGTPAKVISNDPSKCFNDSWKKIFCQ